MPFTRTDNLTIISFTIILRQLFITMMRVALMLVQPILAVRLQMNNIKLRFS